MAAYPARWHGGRMLTSRASRVCLLTLLGALAAVASSAPGASAAAQRYASAGGSGTACSAASPCSITQAVSDAQAGDEVIVNPGDYSLTTALVTSKPITIHGVAGQPRPRLQFDGPSQSGLSIDDSTLRYVEIDQVAQAAGLWAMDSSTVDQVIVKGPGGGFAWSELVAIENSTIRNSIVVASGSNARAIVTGAPGSTIASTYRNVTALATGSGGVAVEANAAVGGKATVNLINVIARGTPNGLEARTDSSGAQAAITAWYTNFADPKEVGTYADIVGVTGNQSAAPSFADWATGDYRQSLQSPTINAGISDPANGAFDVDGDPRAIGMTDIGADEFVVAPASATTGPASAITHGSATLSGSVNPGGSPTTYHFEYGSTSAYGSTTSTVGAGSGTGAVAAGATLSGLSPSTTYHYRLVATNAGGATKGADKTFTSAAPPPPAPTPPSPTPTSPAPARPSTPTAAAVMPAFAGVKLVSSRLSFAGGFIALKLSCPAGTVGRCSGRTKLRARAGATSGAVSAVTLGRAPFAIAAGKQGKIKVRVSRAGRRLLGRARRLRATDTNAARDGAGRSKTTVAAVTIRRRR
jgi:hypothetical protein